MSGRRTLFLDQRCTSVVYCSTCLYRPRANIMRLHSFVFGLVVVAVSAAFLWVISPYAGAVLWGVIFAIMRSEEHTSELQSLMRISYAVFCLNKQKHKIIGIADTRSNQTTMSHVV